MELSLFLAQLFGLTMMIFAAVAFLRPAIISEITRDLRPFSFAMLMAGFIGIVGGLAVILAHNIWVTDWRVVVTLFGWSALLKGVTYIAFPDTIIATADGMLRGRRRRRIALVLAFLLGCYLAYHGFEFGM